MPLTILNENLALGFRSGFGTGWKWSHVTGGGGGEYSNQVWALPRARYEFAFNNKSKADINAIQEHFADMRGSGGRWLLKDWANYSLTSEVIKIATGGETTTQIIQSLGSSNALSLDRKYIKSGTLSVLKNGSTFSASETDGLLTHSALSGGDVIAVSCEFYMKVRFESDEYLATIDGSLGNYGRVESMSAIEVRG